MARPASAVFRIKVVRVVGIGIGRDPLNSRAVLERTDCWCIVAEQPLLSGFQLTDHAGFRSGLGHSPLNSGGRAETLRGG